MSYFDSVEKMIESTVILAHARMIPMHNFELRSSNFEFEKIIKLSPDKADILLFLKDGSYLRIISDDETKMITLLSSKPLVIE